MAHARIDLPRCRLQKSGRFVDVGEGIGLHDPQCGAENRGTDPGDHETASMGGMGAVRIDGERPAALEALYGVAAVAGQRTESFQKSHDFCHSEKAAGGRGEEGNAHDGDEESADRRDGGGGRGGRRRKGGGKPGSHAADAAAADHDVAGASNQPVPHRYHALSPGYPASLHADRRHGLFVLGSGVAVALVAFLFDSIGAVARTHASRRKAPHSTALRAVNRGSAGAEGQQDDCESRRVASADDSAGIGVARGDSVRRGVHSFRASHADSRDDSVFRGYRAGSDATASCVPHAESFVQ